MDSTQRELTEQMLKHEWLQSSGLKAETEGFVVAAQDHSLATRYYQQKIIKNGTDPKCRLCHEFDESIEHIISGGLVLAKRKYLERHDKALIYIHWNICECYQTSGAVGAQFLGGQRFKFSDDETIFPTKPTVVNPS